MKKVQRYIIYTSKDGIVTKIDAIYGNETYRRFFKGGKGFELALWRALKKGYQKLEDKWE